MSRLPIPIALALVTSVWCWVLTAGHGIWSFGIMHGYLDGGRIPSSPTFPVTYGSFFIDSFAALWVPFTIILLLCLALPTWQHLIIVLMAWLIGALVGASQTIFAYQIDFGATWGPGEGFRGLYYHPIVTPFWLLIGLAGTASLTRSIRQRGLDAAPPPSV